MDIYDTVLSLLGIKQSDVDTEKHDQIQNVINIVSNRLLYRLKTMLPSEDVQAVPKELEPIVVEVSVKRFNLIGSEGMDSHNVDGESISFSDADYFDAYEDDINRYVQSKGRSVGVQFL